MADKCFDTNLQKYSGTSQQERALPALSGDFAKVDERATADLVLFAKKYGAYLNYYDTTNTIAGTWENMMGTDVSVIIADIVDWPTRRYNPFLDNVIENITSTTSAPLAKQNFKTIFDFIFSLASALDRSLRRLPADSVFCKISIGCNQVKPCHPPYLAQQILFRLQGLVNRYCASCR